MRIGLNLPTYVAAGADPVERLNRLEAEVELAERLGFDNVLFGHHYVTRSSFLQPLSLVAHLAAGTSRIRLGFGVFLLPLHAPIGLAEELSTLDLLTGGRLILGVGAGYRPAEFAAMEVPFEARFARFERNITLLQRLWSGETVEYSDASGAMFEAKLNLMPAQAGGPPIWIGAKGPKALERVARLDCSWLALYGADGTDALGETATQVRDHFRAYSRTVDRPFPVVADVFVAATDSLALESARKYVRPGIVRPEHSSSEADEALSKALVIGSIDTVAEHLATWESTLGMTDAVLRIDLPEASHSEVLETIDLLAQLISTNE